MQRARWQVLFKGAGVYEVPCFNARLFGEVCSCMKVCVGRYLKYTKERHLFQAERELN